MKIRLRAANLEDAEQVFEWRNTPWIVSLSTTQCSVTWNEHIDWFNRSLTSCDRLLLIIELNNEIDIGTVRIDKVDASIGLITIYLLESFTGKGIGVKAIEQGCFIAFEQLILDRIYAYIRQENYPSISAFTKAGFIKINSSVDCPKNHHQMVFHKFRRYS